MTVETLRAGCKINLFLRVTGVRKDGLHTLESLFLPLEEPCDVMTVSRDAAKGLTFSCSDEALAENNILQKTYGLFSEAASFAPNIRVFLQKGIPYGAGLGGGSSDAAVFLRYLNKAALLEGRTPLDEAAMVRLAAEIGSDVPFFLSPRPALVQGAGECITPVENPVKGLHLVLVCPRIHVATAWAFRAWDEAEGQKPAHGILTNKGENDSRPLVRGIYVQNDLAAVVFARHPELRDITAILEGYGADAAAMSGSGSSLFGLFSNGAGAERAASFLRNLGERVFRHVL